MNTAETTAGKKPVESGVKQIFRLTLSLLIVTVIAAFLLGLVNALTADTIARQAQVKRTEAMLCVAPDADRFSDLYFADPTVDGISGAYHGTSLVGYCVEVSPNGFGGAISLMVGVDLSGSVTGVTILDHSETPGLGAKATDPSFLDQYLGLSGTISIDQGDNSINAITGATVTSKAITEGVNTALAAILNYDAEGGNTDV